MPLVSLIVPCRNEADRIGEALTSLLSGWQAESSLEVIVVDGDSEDGTREVVSGLRERWPMIRLISNPQRTVPHGLNLALASARGSVIVRADAHATYPRGYISTLVDRLHESGADNVGCALDTAAGADTAIARAIALAMSHPFGIGDSQFRLGTDRPVEVETVPFGCYRREVFERIGMFDEQLVRNQDDEFNYRLRRAGGRIVLVPGMRVRYLARSTFRDLWRMALGYGLYKPLVLAKVGRIYAVRPFAPGLLVLCAVVRWRAPLLAYLALNVFFSLRAGRDGIRGRLATSAAFTILHAGYGCGVLMGMFKLLGRRSPKQYLRLANV